MSVDTVLQIVCLTVTQISLRRQVIQHASVSDKGCYRLTRYRRAMSTSHGPSPTVACIVLQRSPLIG